jgi:excisionase family DNA binding protein
MTNAFPLSIDETCRYLGINRDVFYQWIDTKQPQAYCPDVLQKFKKADSDK